MSILATRSPIPSWESAAVREQKIAKARRARYKDLRPARRLSPDLLADVDVDRLLSRSGLAQLLARQYTQPVVSLYLDLVPDEVVGTPKSRLKLFNSMRHSELASRSYLIDGLSAAQRARLNKDLDELEGLIQEEDPEGSRSLVAFKAGQELAEASWPRVKTTSRVSIDVDPYVSPIEAVLEAHRPVLVVAVRKDEAELWSYRLGGLRRIRKLEASLPPGKGDVSRPGKDQRHRETHLIWHLKATAEGARKLFERSDFEHLVLTGDDAVLTELEKYLHVTIGQKVIGRIHPSPEATPGEWQGQIESVLAAQRRRLEEEELEKLGDYGAAGVLFAGLGPALEIVNRLLSRRLFVRADLNRPGFVCRQHHFLALDGGRCPFCGAELFPAENVIDEMVEVARFHKTELTTFEAVPEGLDAYQGVAAVTYYPVDPSSLPALSSAAQASGTISPARTSTGSRFSGGASGQAQRTS